MKKHILKFLLLMILFVTTCMCLKETTFAKGAEKAYAVLDGGTLTFYYDTGSGNYDSDVVYYVVPDASSIPWINNTVRENAKYVVFDSTFKDYNALTSTAKWFSWGNVPNTKLVSISGLENLNTSNVTDMSRMFWNSDALETLTFGGVFDTSNVKNMYQMFYSCDNLTSVDLGEFKTSNVTNMCDMFSDCKNLTSLDLSSFDTNSVTDMSAMFRKCESITEIKVGSFVTDNVTDMRQMFGQCSSLATLDVSNFNTTNVTDMNTMFYGCEKLSSIDVSGFTTTNVTNVSGMFANCVNLKKIDISNFDTSHVNDFRTVFYHDSNLQSINFGNMDTSNATMMNQMFEGCSSLEVLDISSFSTNNAPTVNKMFNACTSLKSIYVSNKWDSSKCSGTDVFAGCTSLSGGNGTVYDSTKVDYTYARIDGGIDNPGYFYKKVEPGNIEIDTVGDVSSELVINNIEENVGMTEEEIIELNSGDEFATVLEVNETTPDEDTNNKVNELLVNEEVKKVCALDISLFLKNITDNTSRPITETRQNVEVKIDLPAELIPSPSEEVGVIRIHEGVSEILPTRYDAANGRIIFNTEKFSIYVIYLKAGSNNGGNESFNYLDPLRSTLKTLIAYNATDTMIVWEEGTGLPYDVMQLIKESNVTVEFKYTYEGVDYDVLINKSNVPSEYVEWYGPLYLAGLSKNYSNIGLTVHGEYVVVPDDTLNVLSARFNTTVDELMRLNPFIKDSHWIYPGQVIKY